jgi:hypothetical protein
MLNPSFLDVTGRLGRLNIMSFCLYFFAVFIRCAIRLLSALCLVSCGLSGRTVFFPRGFLNGTIFGITFLI